MKRLLEIQGPYIQCLGCFTPAQDEPFVTLPDIYNLPANIIEFSSIGVPHSGSQLKKVTFGSRWETLRRSSGVSHSRSSARSTVYATILAKAMLSSTIEDRTQIGIALASTSSTQSVAYMFECCGFTEGWDLVDPFAFPNTIPSALCTQISLTLGLDGFALSFLDGFLGFFHALEFVTCTMLKGNIVKALVLAAEEIMPIHEKAHKLLNRSLSLCEGASGLLVSTQQAEGCSWRIALLGQGTEASDLSVPPHWKNATTRTILSQDDCPFLYSLTPTFALSELLSCSNDKAILYAILPTVGWRVLGFEKVDGNKPG